MGYILEGNMPLKMNAMSIAFPPHAAPESELVGATQLSPPLPQVFQRVEEWCWAACVQMVLNRLGMNVQQCDIVNKVFDKTICCATPDDGACNQPVDPSDVVGVYQKCGHQAQLVAYPVSFEGLQSEILVRGRPVEVGMAWAGTGGHVALV